MGEAGLSGLGGEEGGSELGQMKECACGPWGNGCPGMHRGAAVNPSPGEAGFGWTKSDGTGMDQWKEPLPMAGGEL